MATVSSTRDLLRFRPVRSPGLLALYKDLVSLLVDSEHWLLRTAFHPAVMGTGEKASLADSDVIDDRIKTLLQTPPSLVLVQAVPTPSQIATAWSKGAMDEAIVLPWALHTEFEADKDKVDQANLQVFILAALSSELAQWIHTKTFGYKPTEGQQCFDDQASMNTTNTMSSFASTSSVHSMTFTHSRAHVGDKAIVRLFGCDYELLTYAVGERQVIKRRAPSLRSALLGPPLIFRLIGDTPSMIDASKEPPTKARVTPAWKNGDSMYAVVSALTPAGVAPVHGFCEVDVHDEEQ